ncbi:MAG: type I pantothenate kinase [Gammaproteobacteria bacterium]|nr:type I pantothenate kinase [Gammaproteobacteria bacterium]
MEIIYSPYLRFDRFAWRDFRGNMPLTLTNEDIVKLRGKYESVSLDEVIEVYLPLSRLLNLYVTAAQELFQVTAQFLGHPEPRVPYIIGIVGSVAVGKSTTSRVLQALLSTWDTHPNVEIVTTDGFLYPNEILAQKNLLQRKGFPESYDLRRLITFLNDLKAGKKELEVPIYSHQYYDVTSEVQKIHHPDIVILEGLNLLQQTPDSLNKQKTQVFATDYFDFSIYVDADTSMIKEWYLERFMKFRELARKDPSLFLHQFTAMSDKDALYHAEKVWIEINALNLNENILPYKERAKLILHKDKNHSVQEVYLRKI